MSRPRIPIGGYGEIAFIQRSKGKVESRTRFRDWDGQTRLVQATASSRPAAEAALKRRLAERNAFQPVDTTLTPDSPFPALVDYWLADLDLENRIAPATRFNYERDMNRLVLPAFRGYALREIGVGERRPAQGARQAVVRPLEAGEDCAAARVQPRGAARGDPPQPDRRRRAAAQAEADADRAYCDRGQRDPSGDQGVGAVARQVRPEPVSSRSNRWCST
ncbi:hypothetical protein [Aestuariimicrobium ganziense]|uniref:hypothetical protein n=1 Tax=Aestuariimicrobium ganziense TaxID=2773677 RepID=UPI0019458468|nr:hypothetical protein [Aestuariimicrobium ganziense]